MPEVVIILVQMGCMVDTEQLLRQVKDAIQIFEVAHVGKEALFIFDQSSAHASLPPDALKDLK